MLPVTAGEQEVHLLIKARETNGRRVTWPKGKRRPVRRPVIPVNSPQITGITGIVATSSVPGLSPRDRVTRQPLRHWVVDNARPPRSIARLGGKRRELNFVGPARAVLGVQVIEGLGDLDRVDDGMGAVLVARHCPRTGRVD